MCVARARILGIPHEITNVNGSGCSLGHPIAATGARMIVTMMHELRRRGGGIGVASMCAGGGMGSRDRRRGRPELNAPGFWRQKVTAVSCGGRDKLTESFGGSIPSEGLAGPAVELAGDVVEVRLAVA